MTDNNYTPTSDDKNIAVLSHLLGIFLPIVSSLVIWLATKETSKFGSDQAREALNFQISMAIYFFVSSLLTFVLIGFLLLPLLMLAYVILCIIAAYKVSKDEFYLYPLTLRLVS